ncbi:MAG: peptidase MA family metallohydrolase [Bacteroidota bacterium]|nr:peptidase MA family metallohydrolase [Bacteroidota bacterium]
MRISLIVNTIIVLVFIGCSKKPESTEKDGWEKETQVLKTIKNVKFNFPASGYAFDNKNHFVVQCFEAMRSNAETIGIGEFKDTIQIRFLRSREDMFSLTAMKSSGMALAHLNALYVVADGEKTPPIKHELMHLIAMHEWGYPHYNSTWLNEGLAAFAEDNCNGYNVAQIYRYFMETDKLIHIDSLTSNFYSQLEMIAYHQSAYVVEYLLNNYSIEQFQRLWTQGFDSFELIYGISFSKAKTDLEKTLLEKYPSTPDIDWETFKKGCK